MSWGKYIVNANESITPATFKASDEASNQHNQEVFGLESRIAELESDNKKLREALDEIAMYADETGIAFIAKKALKEAE